MIHNMKLWDDSFKVIKDGSKTIEMRLNDEKRSLIKVDDIIIFENTKNKDIFKCVVINIYKYSNFEELYKYHDKISIGYKENEIANPQDMFKYYSQDNIDKYGVIGIEIKLI